MATTTACACRSVTNTKNTPIASSQLSLPDRSLYAYHHRHDRAHAKPQIVVCRAGSLKPSFWDPREKSKSQAEETGKALSQLVERANSTSLASSHAAGNARRVRGVLAGLDFPSTSASRLQEFTEDSQSPLLDNDNVDGDQIIKPVVENVGYKSTGQRYEIDAGPGQEEGGRNFLSHQLIDAGPSTPAPEYKLLGAERLMLDYFHRIVAKEIGEEYHGGGFEGMVRSVRKLSSKYGSASTTQLKARNVFYRLLPPGFPVAFAAICRALPDWFVNRHAAAFTFLFLRWLVGPMKMNDVPEDVALDKPNAKMPPSVAAAIANALKPDGVDFKDNGYRQGVLVERCRVLEETGCASVCLNVCKMPTQSFFTDEIGLPLTMVPNYETFECQFVFGATPKVAAEDEAFDTPCFTQCPTARAVASKQCHHLEWEDDADDYIKLHQIPKKAQISLHEASLQ